MKERKFEFTPAGKEESACERADGKVRDDMESRVQRGRKKQGVKAAFTLAEVLITLTIIGVVAAISIPVLYSNTQGKEYNAAKQKARMSIGEAFKLVSVNGDIDTNKSAKEMVDDVLVKYLKINKSCKTAKECGFADKIKNMSGSSSNAVPSKWRSDLYTMYGNPVDPAKTTWSTSKKMAAADAAYFQTLDGFSVALYYNPHCASSEQNDLVARDYGGSDASYKGITIAGQWAVDTVCFNAVYDMNGPKGPNQVGKDVGFVGGFYEGAAARSAAVLPMDNDSSAKQMTGNNSAVAFCEKMGKDVSLPTIDELTLIYLNNTLAGEPSAPFCSRSAVPGMASAFRYVNFSYGSRDWTYSSTSTRVRCVRTDG